MGISAHPRLEQIDRPIRLRRPVDQSRRRIPTNGVRGMRRAPREDTAAAARRRGRQIRIALGWAGEHLQRLDGVAHLSINVELF